MGKGLKLAADKRFTRRLAAKNKNAAYAARKTVVCAARPLRSLREKEMHCVHCEKKLYVRENHIATAESGNRFCGLVKSF